MQTTPPNLRVVGWLGAGACWPVCCRSLSDRSETKDAAAIAAACVCLQHSAGCCGNDTNYVARCKQSQTRGQQKRHTYMGEGITVIFQQPGASGVGPPRPPSRPTCGAAVSSIHAMPAGRLEHHHGRKFAFLGPRAPPTRRCPRRRCCFAMAASPCAALPD